jgi:hypothetical protein
MKLRDGGDDDSFGASRMLTIWSFTSFAGINVG